MGNKGTFDQLNDALFAQLDKLQSIDPRDKDAMEQTIEQSRAVSQLAGNIIGNVGMAVKAMQLYDEIGMGAGDLAARTPRMLGGGDGKG